MIGKDYLKIEDVIKNNEEIRIKFSFSNSLSKYFNSNFFYAKYSNCVEGTPDSIAVIPLIVQLLPIVWLSNATLTIPKLDNDFFESIENFKNGYRLMYPQLQFKGNIEIENLESNVNESGDINCGTFFSGGADAYATLITHIHESPTLITVRGADISLDDNEGWKIVVSSVKQAAEEFNLPSIFIESNFTTMLNQGTLNELCKEGRDSWWHGFQHGIGLIGLAAPLAWINKWHRLYIASTFTPKDKGKVTCASDPDIDENVRFCDCKVIHDCYELTRQDKIRLICEYGCNSGKKINLRVCYAQKGGKNCCHCEKCIRTIMAIYACNSDPNEFGFPISIPALKCYKNTVMLRMNKIILPLWSEIQDTFRANPQPNLPQDLDWILEVDLSKFNTTRFKIKKLYFRGRNKLKRLLLCK